MVLIEYAEDFVLVIFGYGVPVGPVHGGGLGVGEVRHRARLEAEMREGNGGGLGSLLSFGIKRASGASE